MDVTLGIVIKTGKSVSSDGGDVHQPDHRLPVGL
jgi:hypothetical protein